MRMVHLSVPAAEAEDGADRLWGAGAQAIEERERAGGRTVLCTALGDDDETSTRRIGVLPQTWQLEFVDVDPEPARTWRSHARPVRVASDLVLHPAWLPFDPDPDVTEVVIEPGAAFGLGDHPTTRLSAAAVHRLVGPGDRVLDVGCGTGVLAIVSALRGAHEVVAIDISEAACEATVDNARRNGVSDLIDVSTMPLDTVDGRYDVVIANILAPTLVAMASDLRRLTAPEGSLIVSGVLRGRYDHVAEALAPMVPVAAEVHDGWACAEFGWAAPISP